jgi:hypothetical protein
MEIPPKRVTLLDRIAKWGQHGVRPELLLQQQQQQPSQGYRTDKATAAGAMHAHTQALSHAAKVPSLIPEQQYATD